MEDQFLSIWDLKYQHIAQRDALRFAQGCAQAIGAMQDAYPFPNASVKVSIPVTYTYFYALKQMANEYGKSPDVIEFTECYFHIS